MRQTINSAICLQCSSNKFVFIIISFRRIYSALKLFGYGTESGIWLPRRLVTAESSFSDCRIDCPMLLVSFKQQQQQQTKKRPRNETEGAADLIRKGTNLIHSYRAGNYYYYRHRMSSLRYSVHWNEFQCLPGFLSIARELTHILQSGSQSAMIPEYANFNLCLWPTCCPFASVQWLNTIPATPPPPPPAHNVHLPFTSGSPKPTLIA